MSIAGRINLIRREMAPFSAKLIAVSKTQPIAAIQEAQDAGAIDFGENYLQEAIPKIQHFQAQQALITWHYLGRVQSKKIKDIARYFNVVHSLDQLEHARKLNAAAVVLDKKLAVFVQVNLDGALQKGGVAEREVAAFLQAMSEFKSLEVLGLMLIPEPASEAETLLKFQRLHSISAQFKGFTQGCLSMGMSGDYKLALDAGSSHVRIGAAIFGGRAIKNPH